MKINKLFLRSIMIFGLVMVFAVSGWGDGGANDSCNGEQIGELHGISATTSRSENGTLYDGSGTDDDNDYYYFRPGVAGTLAVTNYSADRSTDLYISTASCGSNRVLDNGTSYSTTTPITINSTDTVYIRVQRNQNNATTTYSIPLTFTVAAQTPPIMGDVPNQTATVGVAFSLNLSSYVTLTNGDPITAYALTGTLPVGLTLNTTTGTITGTPTTAASAVTFSVTATDNDGISNSDSFSITVNATPTSYVCPYPRTFTVAKTTNIYGDVRIVGNTNMCKNDGNGVCTSPGTSRNNDINMMYSDPDGAGDATTFNASSAKLDLPDGSTVKWAKLYWQGYLVSENDTVKNNSRSVKFAKPGQAYSTINSSASDYDYNWIYFTSDRYYYQGSADVTADVLSGGEGYYTVANIVSELGQPIGGSYGAWALVVVYENADETFKNVTVFDGYQGIVTAGDQGTATTYASTNGCSTDTGARNSMTIPLSGFLTPKSGTVNASLSVFAGEGDKGATGDHMALTDKNGVSRYIANSLNPYDDIFNSTITYNDATVTNITNPVTITPWYSANSTGSDIDTFDVSTDKDGNTLIGNNQTSTNVTLDTSGDGYMPGVFAFSTELYMPELCYDYSYKQDNQYLKADNNGSSGILPMLTGSISDNPLEVAIYLRNKEADINVGGVSFYTDLNTTIFDYVPGSTGTTNINGSGFIDRADSIGGCSYDSTSTSTVACNDGHNVRIGLGNGALGFGQTTAGNLGNQEFVYAKFEIQPNFSGVQDINESLGLKLDYYIQPDVSAPPSVRNYTFGTHINLCPPSSGYTPVWGMFNVVDHAATIVNSLPANNLRTQVARKPFAVDVATYEKNTDGKYTKIPTIDMNTTILVEMIDNDAFHDVNASCANPGSSVSTPIFVRIDNTATDMTIDIPVQNTSYHNFAVKNAAFRIWYFDQNQSLINWTADTSNNSKTLNLNGLHNLYQSSYHTECTTECSSVTSESCFNCIKINYARPLCSRDNFAVRPESYDLRIYDVNQSLARTDPQKNATKIDISNQLQYAPMYATATGRMNLAAGYNYRFDMNATGNDVNLSKVPGYTRYFNGANADYNATMIWEPEVGHITTGCNDTRGKSLSFYVANGQMINSEQNQTQVGEYRLNIIDPAWTAVDWKSSLMNHHYVSGSGFIGGEDCVLSSETTVTDANGKIGCITSSAHSGGGYTYKDHDLTFLPYKFDMSDIDFGVGTLPTAITVGGDGFVYMSDISDDNGTNMSLRATGNIRAVGYNDEVTTNFVTDCYAKALNVSMTSKNNLTHPQGAAFQIRFMDYNTTVAIPANLIYDSNATNINTTALLMPLTEISDGNFTKETKGSLYTVSRFNYDRTVTQPLSPFEASFKKLDVKCLNVADCLMEANLSAAYELKGERAMDFNVTYVYGRIIPRDVRVFGSAVFPANAWYEVFNTPVLAEINLAQSRNTPQWFINTLHNDNNDGDANITVVSPAIPNTVLALSSVSNAIGMETYNFAAVGAGNIPYSGKAHINTDPWLWFGTNALGYADPGRNVDGTIDGTIDSADCLHHPCFNINVVPNIGSAGSATAADQQDKKANKATSPTGVFYDYTPATR